MVENIKIKSGKRIRELRISKGLSQEKLAELADIDRTYMTGIENGKRNISITVIEKLAKAFNITISEFFQNV